jgi:hypothetical protein
MRLTLLTLCLLVFPETGCQVRQNPYPRQVSRNVDGVKVREIAVGQTAGFGSKVLLRLVRVGDGCAWFEREAPPGSAAISYKIELLSSVSAVVQGAEPEVLVDVRSNGVTFARSIWGP